MYPYSENNRAHVDDWVRVGFSEAQLQCVAINSSVFTLGCVSQQMLQAMLSHSRRKTHCHLRGVGDALLIVVPAHRQANFIYFSLNDYAAFLGIYLSLSSITPSSEVLIICRGTCNIFSGDVECYLLSGIACTLSRCKRVRGRCPRTGHMQKCRPPFQATTYCRTNLQP